MEYKVKTYRISQVISGHMEASFNALADQGWQITQTIEVDNTIVVILTPQTQRLVVS